LRLVIAIKDQSRNSLNREIVGANIHYGRLICRESQESGACDMRKSDATTIFTLGYSVKGIDAFIETLGAYGVTLVADIRQIPQSRHRPEFSREFLEKALKQAGIGYVHMKALGGLRHPLKDSRNTGWRNLGFRGYADYMQTDAFAEAIGDLIDLAKEYSVAVICAEGNPFRCHRLLVADALAVRGVRVVHIASAASAREHTITPFASVKGTQVTYPEPARRLVE
jgi:uncharacterized protein (DUF488 family)